MTGHRPWAEVRAMRPETPADAAEVAEHIAAMEAVIRLSEARERLGVTQVELTDILGAAAPNVPPHARGGEISVSTIRDLVESLGGELKISAVFPERTIELVTAR